MAWLGFSSNYSTIAMPLAVLPALVADVEEFYNVQFDAFKDELIMQFLYPGGVDRPAHCDATVKWWNHDKTGYHIKCVDTETGKIVGIASWDIFWKPNGDGGFERPAGIPWLSGKEKEQCEAVLGPMWDLRRLTRATCGTDLSAVAVHPDCQRRGIGSLLIQWGINAAEQLQVPIYAESSKAGYALYERMGFERLTHVRLVHKAELMGEAADVEVPLMVKLPSAAKSMSFKEWEDKGFPESYQ
ncbi:putative acyltransferase SID5 [Paramyrothecium foliicola]|nr:putative acyltransferase SID5 [Paramyrothecium foliicola]